MDGWTKERPTKPGLYLVQLSGDSEHDDMGGLIYEFGPYLDMCVVSFDPGSGEMFLTESYGEVFEEIVLKWYGPIPPPASTE